MRLVFFFTKKYFKFNVDSGNEIKNPEKDLLCDIIPFQLVAINSSYFYENTGSWQSTC